MRLGCIIARNHERKINVQGINAMDSTAQFYDALASAYHFIFPDWQQSARKQGAILHQLIQSLDAGTVETLWDCTCGIGTQALGLAEYHYASR